MIFGDPGYEYHEASVRMGWMEKRGKDILSMPTSMRSYYSESDIPAVLALRRRCTTPENVTDYPSLTDLHELLNPLRSELHTPIRLWEDEAGQVVAYAHVYFPYCNLYVLIDPVYWQT